MAWLQAVGAGVAGHVSRSPGVDLFGRFLIFCEPKGYLKHVSCNAMTEVQASKQAKIREVVQVLGLELASYHIYPYTTGQRKSYGQAKSQGEKMDTLPQDEAMERKRCRENK